MDLSNDWNQWKDTLGKAVNLGEDIGLKDKTINNIAQGIGSFLSDHIEPRNDEERLLKELWDVANEHDRHVIAKLVVKMTKK